MGAPGTTPGEWSTTGIAEGSEFEVRAGDQYVCACPFDTEPFAPVPPYSEARANAHQSAASPDLYDALADPALEACLYAWVNEKGIGRDEYERRSALIDRRSAALAKARGE